jgi:serine/threonine protein kinase
VPRIWDPHEEERDGFTCEAQAYQRLKQRGLCDSGDIPDIFGVISRLDPRAVQPHLDRFLADADPPRAVVIEYVEGLHMIDLSNFTLDRIEKLTSILSDIHDARVLHGDLYPRNMMVSAAGRVLFLDFDRAQTFAEIGPLPERHQAWIDNERVDMSFFASALVRTHRHQPVPQFGANLRDPLTMFPCNIDQRLQRRKT